MKLSKRIVINTCIILLLLLSGCDKIFDICDNEYKGPGALVLTFDDRHIDEWFKADSIFSIYDWKTTFCVSAYGTLTENEKLKLNVLQNNGHEIASHSTHHYNALSYLSDNSIEEYIKNEILPSLNEMQIDGLNITSFVYPGGVRSVELDLALFDYFSVLRGTTYDRISANKQNCYLKKGEDDLLVYGLGIDNHYSHFDIDYIINLLEYADKENIALILYGHKIADNDTSKYVTSYNTLNEICSYVQQHDMEFLTLKELVAFNRN